MTLPGNSSGQPVTRLAVVLYGLLVLAALAWGALAGRPWLVLDPARSSWRLALLGAAAGLVLGGLIVLLSRIARERLQWARELYQWFAGTLGSVSRRGVLALAALSAVGEELFFRGAMQPSLGLWATSAVFAALHLPPRPGLWPWTASAGAIGLLLGSLAQQTHDLAGAVIAHFVINFLNLLPLARSGSAP